MSDFETVLVVFTARYDTDALPSHMRDGKPTGNLQGSGAANLLQNHRPEHGYIYYETFPVTDRLYADSPFEVVPEDELVNIRFAMRMNVEEVSLLFGGDWHMPDPDGYNRGITCESVAAHVARNHDSADGVVGYTVLPSARLTEMCEIAVA